MLINDIYNEFLFDLEIKNYSIRTIKGYRNNNRAFLNFLINEHKITNIEEITTGHIKSYLLYLKKKGLSEIYINNIQKNIRSFFKFCVQEGHIAEKRNPALNLKWMKEAKVLIQTFTDDEVRRMLDVYNGRKYLDIRNKLILMFLVDLGIRNFELCSITCLDVMETTISIHGKGNKERTLFLSPILKKYMIRYERVKNTYFQDKLKTDSNYFLSMNAKKMTLEAIQRVVKIAGERAKVRDSIRCSPHTIRHYYAQKQLRLGLDVYSLSRLLGHESTVITNIYLKSIQDENIVELSKSTSPLMNL
ncbi:MAG: recombinase [Bacillales bacterium]|nr:recombinase [Bacillales bacterium]